MNDLTKNIILWVVIAVVLLAEQAGGDAGQEVHHVEGHQVAGGPAAGPSPS